MDLIVMPESCDIPCLARMLEQRNASVSRYNKLILDKARGTAIRCDAVVCINARLETESGLANTTYVFDRRGEIAGKYLKQHPTPGEVANLEQDTAYSFEYAEPHTVVVDGVRYAFLTCYDFYFYEAFSNISRQKPDVIIGCSHQRSDTHRALEIMSQFLAYNTNAYVVRSSVSMDEHSDIGGASMVVAPTGEILAHLYSRVGMATVGVPSRRKCHCLPGRCDGVSQSLCQWRI